MLSVDSSRVGVPRMRPGPRRSNLAEHQVGGIYHDGKKESSKERLAGKLTGDGEAEHAEDGHCFS